MRFYVTACTLKKVICGAIFLDVKRLAATQSKASLSRQSIRQYSVFHSLHTKVARLHLSEIDHVIIYLHGQLLLLKCESEGKHIQIASADTAAIGHHYIRIKNLVHVSVSLTLLTQAVLAGKRSLQTVRDDLAEIMTELHAYQGATDLSLLEAELVSCSTSFITSLQTCMDLSHVLLLLNHYLKSIQKLNERLCGQATKLQLSSLDDIIRKWLAEHSIVLKTSRTLIVGPDGAREGLIEMQYFDALYQTECMALYVTMLPKQMSSLTISDLIEELGKRELNRIIGMTMLQDEQGMNKDVLAQYAPTILSTLFGEKKGICPMKSLQSETRNLIYSIFNKR
ncbi:MAG: hypothetical protein P4M14_01770 [Gammaproteobacteria bacterium]|nr:hypothetical protein [Gammaproteobacteria bacterium]